MRDYNNRLICPGDIEYRAPRPERKPVPRCPRCGAALACNSEQCREDTALAAGNGLSRDRDTRGGV